MSDAKELTAVAPPATSMEHEVVLIRVFDAPRTLIFDAWTKPEMLRRLHWRRDWSLVGVTWRFVVRDLDITDMEMRGTYRENIPLGFPAGTEMFTDEDAEGDQAKAIVVTVVVEEQGKPTLTNRMLYSLKESSDAVIGSGVSRDAVESYDRLAEYLEAFA